MKLFELIGSYVILLMFFTMNFSCGDDDNALSQETCSEINEAMIADDLAALTIAINLLTENKPPVSTNNDPLGHQDNLKSLIATLDDCDELKAKLECYACIETLPVISEIKVELDINGDETEVILDISTPEDGDLELVGIH